MFDLPIKITATTDDYMVGEFESPYEHWKAGTLYANVGSVTGVFKMIDERMNEAKREMASVRSGRDFNGFLNWKECIRVFREAPHEINEFVRIDAPLKMHETPGAEVMWDVTGDVLDVGRYLDGEPECVGVMKMGNPLSLFANIYFDVSATGGTPAQTLARRGANLMAYVDFLESNNIRAKVTAYRGNETALILVNVKDYGRMLTMNSLAVTSHPDFLRRICFRISENSKTWQSGYGTPAKSQAFMNKVEFPDDARTLNIVVNPVYGSEGGIDEAFVALVKWTRELVEEGRGGTYRVKFSDYY